MISNDDCFEGFKNVIRVILPPSNTDLGTSTAFAYQDGSSVKVYQKILTDYSSNVKSLQIDIVKAGGLAEVSDAHYYTDAFTNAPCVDVVGSANDDDVTFFNELKTKRLNLVGLTYAGKDTGDVAEDRFMSIKNVDGLEYIILPDLGIDGGNFSKMFTETPSLKGVAQINSSNNYLSAALNNAAGTMNVLTTMIGDTRKRDIRKLKLSGDMNAFDISNDVRDPASLLDGTTTVSLSKEGHWIDKNDTENLAEIQQGAFSGYSTENSYLDFSDARFENNQDLNLNCAKMTSGNSLETILLPTDKNFTTIPHASLANLGTNMKGLTIPGNIQRIERSALQLNATLSKTRIKTTKTDAEGNGSYADDMIIDNGPLSITLPEKLKFVGTAAFAGDDWCHDVYVLALEAPECERDAFGSNSYTGNNGFDSSMGVCQDAYMKNNNVSFAVLHYPSALYGTDEEKKYTDPTRVYTLEDNTGATDANGIPLTWPSQVEWNHAYTTAYWGYIWGAWNKELSGAGTVTFANVDQKQATVDGWWEAGDHTDATKYTTKDYDYTKYVGWHQFILANRLNSVDDKNKPNRDLSRFKSNDWYTFCVPYNIRKSELLEYFGVKAPLAGDDKVMVDGKELTVNSDLYPIVSTLVGVKRDAVKGQITLIFSKDLVNEDVTINAEGNAPEYSNYSVDDPIIIKEGHPYLIKPYLPESKLTLANADKYIVKIADNDTDPHIYAKDAGGADRTDLRIPYEEHIVLATNGSGYGNPIEDYTYRFGGAYSNLHNVPRYAYYLANSKSQNRHIWFYHSTESTKKWGQYSAIVAAKPTSIKEIPSSDEAKLGKNPSVYFTGVSDDLPGAAKAKYSMEFDDGSTTTGIKNINTDKQGSVEYIDGQAILVGNVKVYNISGQYVGNSLNGLAKGIYIVNGKKYVVK